MADACGGAAQAGTLTPEEHCHTLSLSGNQYARGLLSVMIAPVCRMAGCGTVAGALEDRRQWLTQAAEQAEKDRLHAESQVQAAKTSLKSENDIRVGSREVRCSLTRLCATEPHKEVCMPYPLLEQLQAPRNWCVQELLVLDWHNYQWGLWHAR